MASIDDTIIRVILKILYFIGLYFVFFWISVLLEREDKSQARRNNSYPEITIIIPVYNEEDCLNRTISKLYEVNYPKDKLKVICVNDGSTDSSLKILKKLNKKYPFKLVDQKNQGKYMAMNNSLKFVDTKYFACIDADSFIEKNSLKKVVDCFEQDARVAAVTPMMKVYKPKSLLVRAQYLEYIINMFYVKIFSKINCIHVVPGPLGSYRTDVIKKLGLFKEGHKTEDLEMGMRLQNNNYKIKHCSDAVIYTKAPETKSGLISQRVRWYKGTILNVVDYKHMILNKKYGDFGFFHIPLVAISGLMIILGAAAFIYSALKAIIKGIHNFYLINFDFSYLISNINFSFDFLSLNWKSIFFSVIMLGVTFIVIFFSIRNSREDFNIFNKIKDLGTFLFYVFVYNFIMFYIWLKVFRAVIFKKDYKWIKVK